ncbi:MAG TPA: threonine synthase [Bacillota bacterium]|nr:threonine synthase [Bacillota bacterium]
MTYSYISHLSCSVCDLTFDDHEINQLCSCGAPLLVNYDLAKMKETTNKSDIGNRQPTLWRYHELLPIRNEENIVSLGEGMTPLIQTNKIGEDMSLNRLYIKDEGIIPTGTFKARGAAVGMSKAKELGIKQMAMPTNGNAGSAWSAYATRANIKQTVVMPNDSPEITKKECQLFNADVHIVDGLINDAGKIVKDHINDTGKYDVSTLKEPYRIEGKKTMGLEIAEQLDWTMPDVILYPTGGGVGLIGIYKALKELKEIGWVTGKLPRLVAVQSTNCAPIVKAWENGDTHSTIWKNSETIAFGINVPKALGDFLVLEAIEKTNGCAIAISDEDLLEEQQKVAAEEGLFICPEGAAVFSAARQLKQQQWIHADDVVICLNTGAGIKYPNTFDVDLPILNKNDRL